MRPWWERWPGRRETELESFARRGLVFTEDPDALQRERLVLVGTIELDDETVELIVSYPDTYPDTRFAVAAPALDLPRHQHPDGKNLCVFPRGNGHWDRRFLAGDIVAEQVPELIRLVRAGGSALLEAEEPQGEPSTDYYRYWSLGGIVLAGEILEAARGIDDGGQLTLLCGGSGAWLEQVASATATDPPPIGTALVSSLRRGERVLARADPALVAAFTGPTFTGTWVRLSAPPPVGSPDVFLRHIRETGRDLPPPAYESGSKAGVSVLAVVFPEEVRHGELGDGWVFAIDARPRRGARPRPRRGQRSRPADLASRVALVRGLRASLADLTVRVPELEALPSRHVSIVGLGTLGSHLAKEMARNLVGELRVADIDFVDPATAVRWEAGLRASGVSKALFVADAFRRDYPYTAVRPYHAAVGLTGVGDFAGDRELLAALLDGSDLLLDATADDDAGAALARAAWDAGVTAITMWSIEGMGGVVARLVPGETGCHHCLELHLSPDYGAIPLPAPPVLPRRVQPRGCADPTFTSPAPDLLPLVDLAARMAFGELCRGHEGGYPRHRHDLHVLFLREPNGSLYEPVRWGAHPLPVHPACPCHE